MPKRDLRALLPEQYAEYMRSPAWRATRQRWIASKYPKACARCFKPWGKGDHLHHRTYKRLGVEWLIDLIPFCAECHRVVHAHQRRTGKPLWWATTAMAPEWGRYCQEQWEIAKHGRVVSKKATRGAKAGQRRRAARRRAREAV